MAKKLKKLAKKPSSRIIPKESVKGLDKPEVEKAKKTKIRVIGIGGGGGNIVSEIASKVKKASFVAANTDLKALKEISKKVERFHFGENLTQGLGTGMNPELGEAAAQNDKDRIKKLLEGQDLCILVATLGGGTGSGAVPIFAKIARNLGLLTYGIFTLPFNFEGEKKMEIATLALEKLKPKLNAITIIPNERIFQIIDKTTPLKQALSAINKNLSESLEGLIETIYTPGLINIDFSDLRTILQGRGRLTYLNTAEVNRKEGSAKEVINKALNSPLYLYGIKGAKGILFNISGQKDLSLLEISQISKAIHDLSNKNAKIIFGISQNKKYEGLIRVTLLAVGCGGKHFPKKPKKPTLKPVPTIVKPVQKVKVSSSKGPEVNLKKTKNFPSSKIKIFLKPKAKLQPETTEANLPKTIPSADQERLQPERSHTFRPPAEGGPLVRKNALQIKIEMDEAEKELIEKEKFWERPAFLRRKTLKS